MRLFIKLIGMPCRTCSTMTGSAARVEMAARKLIVFKHDSELGNAPASKLFDLITVEKNCGDAPPRSFGDFNVTVGSAPKGVVLLEML